MGKCLLTTPARCYWPIGSVYVTTSNSNPSTVFGGTWTQIIDDAYLRAVTSGGGSTGGTSSDHKIPISSMPKHSHGTNFQANVWRSSGGWTSSKSDSSANTTSAGGGEPYYPYYYGVYVWVKTA